VVDECNGKIAKLEKTIEDKYNALIDAQHKFDET
jgi:flagellar motility protein MotE (MotC chaperone)